MHINNSVRLIWASINNTRRVNILRDIDGIGSSVIVKRKQKCPDKKINSVRADKSRTLLESTGKLGFSDEVFRFKKA